MAQDISLMGASFLDVPAVELPTVGGGTALFHDRSIPFDFLGVEPEYIKEIYSAEYALADTLYSSWTPSTTAKAIVAAKTISPTYVGDTADYEYILRWRFDADIVYVDGTTMKVTPVRECEELYQLIAKRPSSLANVESDNFNGNNCSTFYTSALLVYNNSSGALTYTWSASYGFYIGATAATFSNATTNTPTITFKSPTINSRCSTTYFSTARAANVDQDNSKVKLVGELWRVKRGTSASRRMYDFLVDLYNDSIIGA